MPSWRGSFSSKSHSTKPRIGAIPIESYNLADRSRIRSPAGRGEDEEAPKKDKDQKDDELPGGEIGFNSVQGEHSTALFRWNVDGKPKDIVIVHAQGASTLRITCKGALIATMSVSNDDVPREHWSVDCRAMKFEFSQPGG